MTLIKVKRALLQMLARLGMVKCPKCNGDKVDVVFIERPIEQKDGFQGIVYYCCTCGNRWTSEGNVPMF